MNGEGWYIDQVRIQELLLIENSLKAKMLLIDELMDEILILDHPEAMREVALFVQEVIKTR